MKKLIVCLMTLIVLVCTGCTFNIPKPTEKVVVPEFSDEYLIGISSGGGYGDYYSSIPMRLIVTTDKKLLVCAPPVEEAAAHKLRTDDFEVLAVLELSDEQYDNILKGIDREKLFKMTVEPDNGVCDGDSYYLYLYGSENQIVKRCGAYMPKTAKFMEMYRAVSSNIPREKTWPIWDEYIDRVIECENSMSVDE